LPTSSHARPGIYRSADIGGARHALTADRRDADIRFSVGYELNDTVRKAILDLPETAGVQAINAVGEDRDGAWVAELTEHLDLSAWPDGSRLMWREPAPRLTWPDESRDDSRARFLRLSPLLLSTGSRRAPRARQWRWSLSLSTAAWR